MGSMKQVIPTSRHRAGRLAGSATARCLPPAVDTSAVETQVVDGLDLDRIAGVCCIAIIKLLWIGNE